MKMKRFLAVLLAYILTVGATTTFAASSFRDVAEDAYYADAVEWAAEQKITEGRGNGIFDPDATVTRAEAVTFLWRMAGEPEPTQTETFADVGANAWYKTAVQWAVGEGITNGTGNGSFSPAVTCSRGMILTMIYRMEGKPFDAAAQAVVPEDSEDWTLEDFGNAIIQSILEGLRSENGFVDVKEGDYFELPVCWAILNEILDENQVDTEARTVQPAAPCPRGEMVYFLYRTAKYENAQKEAEELNKPVEPVATGTIDETVLLEKDGVKVTLRGIECDDFGDAVLTLTVENGTDKLLDVEPGDVYVNTYPISPSAYIPEEEDGVTFYGSPLVGPGETKEIFVGLNDLRDKGIAAICEIEIQIGVYSVTEVEDGHNYDPFCEGEMLTIRTSLYGTGISYDPEGTAIYDADGVKVQVAKAENNQYSGPQLVLSAYNSTDADVYFELTQLKLDGKEYEAYGDLYVHAGRRSAERVYIDLDYENLPTVKEAEITLTMTTYQADGEEVVKALESVTIRFDN